MTGISFDMRRIGATIAQMRRENNMTQMQLADEMGVSFQAVSNWERGQSMPDISKLPELADLFGTTIDQLLGRKVPILEAAAAGSLADTPIRPEELAEAAPLLTPKQMDEASSGVDIDGIDPVLLPSLLPFLDTEIVDRMLHRAAMQGQEISEFLPFASEDAIDAAGLERASRGQDISSMLPFMCEDTIDSIARNKAAKGESISSMLPFMYEDTIEEIALGRIRQRERIDDLLPFVSSRLTNKLAELAFLEK